MCTPLVVCISRHPIIILGWMSNILQSIVVFLSPSRHMLGQCLKLGHNCFLSHPFRFIIHYHPINDTILLTDLLSKLQNKQVGNFSTCNLPSVICNMFEHRLVNSASNPNLQGLTIWDNNHLCSSVICNKL
jgi:hypothetical protein